MIIKNSLRQLARMRKSAILFTLLLVLVAALCFLGRCFWNMNTYNVEQYEDSFMTIGTVEQKANTVKETRRWDAERKDYRTYNEPEYETRVGVDSLDFKNAGYLSGPEQRGYYGAYCPTYELDQEGLVDGIIVEVTVAQDILPDHPVLLTITNVLYGYSALQGTTIPFCDHYNPEPKMLYAGKTYIMSLNEAGAHEDAVDYEKSVLTEYVPSYELNSTQLNASGESIQDTIEQNYFYDEVTPGFYETDIGKRWKALIKGKEQLLHTLPVTGTDNLDLLMAFYRGDAVISSGRAFTEKEYSQGDKVCLVPEEFARNNGLSVGDKVQLPLYYVNYSRSGAQDFRSDGTRVMVNPLNMQGEVYPVFDDGIYRITGVYRYLPGLGEYGLGKNEIIIPRASIKNDASNNIVDYGVMKGCTTSFQIENGKIDEYMSRWKELNIKNIEITFYDRGYTTLKAGMDNMKNMAVILGIMGIIMALLLFFFFTYLFIGRQKERMAIERSMGWNKRQCFLSLFGGLWIIMFIGCVSGTVIGVELSEKLIENMGNGGYYDTEFGNSVAVIIENNPESSKVGGNLVLETSLETMVELLILGSTIAAGWTIYNLHQSPMKLLIESRR